MMYDDYDVVMVIIVQTTYEDRKYIHIYYDRAVAI